MKKLLVGFNLLLVLVLVLGGCSSSDDTGLVDGDAAETEIETDGDNPETEGPDGDDADGDVEEDKPVDGDPETDGDLVEADGDVTEIEEDGDGTPDGDTESVPTPHVVVTGDVAVEIAATITLTAQTVDGADSSYAWASSDVGVAAVVNGVVTGVSVGTAVITATGADTGKSGGWGVYVYQTPLNPEVVITGEVALKVGLTTTLTAETVDGTDSSYAWSSEDETKATVNAEGLVTGVAPGTVVLTAVGADTGKTGVWTMYIWQDTPPAPRVGVTGGFSVTMGETLQLSATTENGVDASYAWSSSDEQIALVDSNGLVTGVAVGEVVITATGATTGVNGVIGVVVQDVVHPGNPHEEEWAGSGHADAASEAFRHWDADGSVPASCAKCHSTYGFHDFLGVDGTAAGTVENSAATDSVVSCVACHNSATAVKTSVVFPSGAVVENVGADALCAECHSGRESSTSIETAITNAAVADDDTVDADLGFKNIHYAIAGATFYGHDAKGAFEYPGQAYDRKFEHVEGVASCVSCHDAHTLEVKADTCSACHAADKSEDYRSIRMMGSRMDYDGDGSTSEGIYYEIEGLQTLLYQAIQAYATQKIGTGILYSSTAYPYWFKDTNGNGTADDGELVNANKYASWTARLVKATFNYQFSMKDPGNYAHNAKYTIQILHDTIADLNGVLTTPVDLSLCIRDDAGHFAGTEEAWRHWDSGGEVEASCAKCHSSEGVPFYLEHGTNFAAETSNGMQCSTCHADLTDFEQIRTVASVAFPSGKVVNSGDNTSNLCMLCHQGRESTTSMNTALSGKEDDTVDSTLSFKNVHYFAAGATRFGSEASGAYEYTGKTYDGFFPHVSSADQCADCHSVHRQAVRPSNCVTCHEGVTDSESLKEIRMASSWLDYDGDGNVEEGLASEIDGLRTALYSAMQLYGTQIAGQGIVYSPTAYPYWFKDLDGNGLLDGSETTNANKYNKWTPRLLKAAFNFQFVTKDPGAYAHNGKYIIALLYDSIESLAEKVTIDMSAMRRNDEGHFSPVSLAYRDWDDTWSVPSSCAKCHSASGFDTFLTSGASVASKPSYGMNCENCHSGFEVGEGLEAPVKYVASVKFPSNVTINNSESSPDSSFVCMSCHLGRQSKSTLDAAIAANTFTFKNIHYLPVGAVLYGSTAAVGYEYTGKTYYGKFNHISSQAASSQCIYCHDASSEAHAFEVEVTEDRCLSCHDEATAGQPETLRKARSADYDGDGHTDETLKAEVDGIGEALYAEIRAYAFGTLGFGIVYDAHTNPYFFEDSDNDGVMDAAPATYSHFDAKLLKATFNYQMYRKEPGAWAHNTKYIIQLLIDSIEDLGGGVTTFTRP